MPKRFKSSTYPIYIGNYLGPFNRCIDAYESMSSNGYDFALVDLQHAFSGRFDDFLDIRNLSSSVFNSSIVGVVNLPSGITADVDSCACECVRVQLRWAVHAGMYGVILRLNQFEPLILSRVIEQFCSENPSDQSMTRLWIECEVGDWPSWDRIRTLCNHPSNVNVCLVYDAAEFACDSFIISRWLGEPVSVLRFLHSTTIDGSPALLRFFRRNAQPIVPDMNSKNAILSLLSAAPELKWEETYLGSYHDTLQIPLQPLADNMDNVVYETFETDRTKYDLYEEAIYRALLDLTRQYPETSKFKLAVVGAGRGGLIDASFRAISRIGSSTVEFEIHGIEKNPNAARTLQFRVADDPSWNATPRVTVSILEADMRHLPSDSGFVDILISELLGSLGDNEASPECIDGVMHWLDPVRGICIPNNYYSTIEPVSCAKVWSAVRDAKKLETPLVVNFHTSFHPSSPLTLFAFSADSGPTRSMSETLTWSPQEADYLLHGFAGYFHADLYGGVTMSTNPPTRTEGMVSWFPAFLPLRNPTLVHAGKSVSVHVYRETSMHRMFIQWSLIEPTASMIHNGSGCEHFVGL